MENINKIRRINRSCFCWDFDLINQIDNLKKSNILLTKLIKEIKWVLNEEI